MIHPPKKKRLIPENPETRIITPIITPDPLVETRNLKSTDLRYFHLAKASCHYCGRLRFWVFQSFHHHLDTPQSVGHKSNLEEFTFFPFLFGFIDFPIDIFVAWNFCESCEWIQLLLFELSSCVMWWKWCYFVIQYCTRFLQCVLLSIWWFEVTLRCHQCSQCRSRQPQLSCTHGIQQLRVI